MAVTTLVFDFGGVFTYSPFTAIDAIGIERGAAPGQFVEIVFGSYHIDGDHPWHRLERGEITMDAARLEIIDLGGEVNLDVDLYEVFASLPRDGGLRTELVDKVTQLKAEDVPMAIVTNNVRELSASWRSLFPVDEIFGEIIDSSFEGVRKPDPAIFELAMERMGGVAAQDSLFLDDHPANVAAARSLGMQAILVEDDIASVIAEIDHQLNS